MNLTRRRLQIGLGLIWLLDAALQFQPYMFSRSFASQIIAPTAPGNPGWISAPVTWTASMVAHHPVLFNAGFASVQLLLALGILWPRTLKLALVASIPWSLAVWWLGEGLGGLFTSAPSPLMGAPGAVVIYALLAVLLWPREDERVGLAAVADSAPAGPWIARVAWLALWGSFAWEMLLPVNRSAQGAAGMIAGMASGQPGWVVSVDRWAATGLTGTGESFSVALAVIMGLIALAVFSGRLATRISLTAAVAISLGIWVVGEDFGGVFTGQGTDPNSGPLLILLALVLWPRAVRPAVAPAVERAPTAQSVRLAT